MIFKIKNENKLNNFYILFYILMLFKIIFIIFYKKIKKYSNSFLYKIFSILIIYLKIFVIFIYSYFNIYDFNYIYFYIYKYNKNILFNFDKNIFNNINIIDKIIEIKKISYTIKKGRIKRYKILLLIGNKQGWIGIGIGKCNNINKAIIIAKIKALNNIYYFKYSILNMYKLEYVYLNYNKIFIKLQFKIYNYFDIKFLLLKYLFECLGYFNCKIIIYYNIINNKYNLLKKLLLVLFNICY
uniref:Small subunit ribosomal protein 5 n=1 Tax=Plasmodium malariae TaxID=5858 RepID=H7CDF3_PLAMA|nr:small subunit ribosomal protein 5 [Plasmodium malariae]